MDIFLKNVYYYFMSKKDILLEELKELRLWRGVFIAIAFTLGSWLVSHIDKYTDKRFIIGFIFEIIIVGQVITLSKKIKAKIKLLGDIE